MTSGGVGTPAINIGRFKTYKVRTKFDNWGRKRWENHNGSKQFSNGCAKIITSLEVVSDQQPSFREHSKNNDLYEVVSE